MGGLSRAIRVEKGHDAVTDSIVDTEYGRCACSPMGRVSRTSLPYAPGGTVFWTAYTYDDIGRTLSVALPNNAGATTLQRLRVLLLLSRQPSTGYLLTGHKRI
jgi:hypothetical protein